MHWFIFLWQYQHDSLAVVSCSLQFLARSPSEVSDFGSSLFSLLFVSLFLRQTFFYSACSWPLFVQSFLPQPHLLLFFSSACSSPFPLSSLCTAVECIWVLVGSPANTASQIPGLAALHPGCRTHAIRHHRQKSGGNDVQYFWKPPGCAIFPVRYLLRIIIRLEYLAEKSTWKMWNLYLHTRSCMFDGHFCSTVFDEERKKVTEATNVEMF